eukprot:jgi/Mesvir1/15423/Mv06607-RA.1
MKTALGQIRARGGPSSITAAELTSALRQATRAIARPDVAPELVCRLCGDSSAAKPLDWKSLCKACRKAEGKKFKASKEGYFRNQVHSLHKTNRRSGRRQVSLTARDLAEIWDQQGGLCAITALEMTHAPDSGPGPAGRSATVDLIDPKAGVVKGNVRLVCRRVKRMKGNDDVDSFLDFCALIGDRSAAPSTSAVKADTADENDTNMSVDRVGSAAHTSWADIQDDIEEV